MILWLINCDCNRGYLCFIHLSHPVMESPKNPLLKIKIDETNCEATTGWKPEELAKLTGIEAYTTSTYTFSILGHNLAPSIIVRTDDINVTMRRTFVLHEKIIENDRIDIIEQKAGTAIKIFARQVEEARNAGYKEIVCIAARDQNLVGYYVWARAGFILKPDGQEDMNNHLKSMKFPGTETAPHMIVLNPDYREWWKENGISWEGAFDLSENSESLQILEKYIKEKAEQEATKKNYKAGE